LKSILCGCALASLLLANSSHAAEPGRFTNYVSLSAGKSSYNGTSGDPSLNLGIGQVFNSHLSAEIFVRTLGFRWDGLDDLLGDTALYPAEHTGIAVLASVPAGTAVNAYGRLGIGRTTLEAATQPRTKEHVTDPSVGVGLVIGTASRAAFKAEATRFTKSSVTTLLIGADIRF
jgi:hypothetical protein